ncbi:hypothetical protein PVA45_08040 (plasmid) [Entomospira entomophila]|uniref:Uncharacterized protein n=1 Tax=Entomospira entomophila TaxID=2719988 RepID=A0A968GBR4_9SPIO|nr:hypothetical protein [Entomospira entomophilus]NIZ41455.1 hypothetical protein [Entomospira entomophilus]WDI36289.1 hypothetical protein PVA45_08040 [Entomospira entomophilus]
MMKNWAVYGMITLVLFGFGWWIVTHRGERNEAIHITQMPGENSLIPEIGQEFRDTKSRSLENRLGNAVHKPENPVQSEGDLRLQGDAISEMQSDSDASLLQALGNPEVQKKLKPVLRTLEIACQDPKWKGNTEVWHRYVVQEIASTLEVSPDRLVTWWHDVTAVHSIEELARKYPNFTDRIWDIYINRTEILSIYENQFID